MMNNNFIKRSLLIILFTFSFSYSFSQSGFSKTINLESSYFLVSSPSDSGFTLIDLYLKIIKFDKSGNVKYNSTGVERLPLMIQSGFYIESGYILSGYTASTSGLRHPILVRVNNIGEIDWVQATDLGSYNLSNCYVAKSLDGGYFTGGTVRDEVTRKYCGYIQKSDSLGNFKWSKIYNSVNKFHMNDLFLTQDGGLIVRSVSNDVGAGMIRIDSVGNILWAKSLEDSSFSTTMLITKDQNYIVCGQNYLTDNFYAAKFSDLGALLWYHEYVGQNCFPLQVIEKKNSDLVYVGGSGSNKGFFFLADSSGRPIYSYEISTDTTNTSLYLQNVIELEDNNCILYGKGNFASNYFSEVMYKINSIEIETCYSNSFEMNSIQKNFAVIDDTVSSFFISGINYAIPFTNISENISSTSDICKIDSSDSTEDISIFPNPATDYIVLSNVKNIYVESIQIFNSIGQEVFFKSENRIENDMLRFSIDLPSGFYFLRILTNKKKMIFKLIVRK